MLCLKILSEKNQPANKNLYRWRIGSFIVKHTKPANRSQLNQQYVNKESPYKRRSLCHKSAYTHK